MNGYRALALAAVAALATAACGDDSPTEPVLSGAQVAGTYQLSEIRFDPQGSLPEVDLLGRIELQNPALQLTSGGVAQLTFRDPETNLLVSVNGTYATTPSAVRVDFGQGNQYARLLLSQKMTLEFQSQQTTTLTFEDETGSVGRARLLELVPEFEGEQLLDPVPGAFRVVFQK